MPTYRVLRKSDHKTIYAYAADTVVEFAEYPLSEFDHVAEAEVRADGSISVDAEWRITKLAFRQRFTAQEKAALEIAALDDPSAPMQQRVLAAALRANQEDVQAANYIDLKRADTRAGVAALEQYGLIAAGRAAEILDTVPTPEELHKGE